MKRSAVLSLALVTAFAALYPATAAAAPQTLAAPQTVGEVIRAKVNGMVCDFCAQSVKKVFGKQPGVSGVDVDLTAGAITIRTTKAGALTDEQVRSLVRKSGYALVEITRGRS